MRLKKEHIIVIESDDIHRSFLVKLLEGQGYSVSEASTGLNGMKKTLDSKPDLIVCNAILTDMTGNEFLREIRLLPETRFIPFLVFAMEASPEVIRKSMNLGADDFLTSRNSNSELLETIAERIKKRNKEKELYRVEQNLFRQRVVSMLPHEFNTPLVGILGGIRILKEKFDDLDDSEKKDLLEIAFNMTRRLERMSRNYTSYLKLEISAGDIKLFDQITSGNTKKAEQFIKQTALEECEEMHRNTDIEFNIDIGEYEISISNQNLALLVSETVNNAIRFSENGKKIAITGSVSNNYMILKVKDSGRGMTEEQIANIGAFVQFEREFYEQQGAGLGLFLAKKITEMHKGKFEITSKLGKGTTVTFHIPVLLN
jgi:two-component system, sensor histidine kinase and response regulator